MSDKENNSLSEAEKMLREKARQALKKNKTPSYSSDDEGGVVSGPLNKDDMKKQADEEDEQNSK